MRQTNVSRRYLIGASLAAGATAAAQAAAPAQAKHESWDRTVDFLIVGTGFAGLAAALEAKKQGLKNVLVIDKMAVAGGNSIINGGAVAAAGTDMQQKAGIRDSEELFVKDILRAGGGLAYPKLVQRIARESVENYQWLRDEVGVKFKAVTFHGGHSVPRSHAVQENSGAGFINPMLKLCEKQHIEIGLRTILDRLIVENGEVVGVQVRTNHRFGKSQSGYTCRIRALKGVLLASGGFSQNVQMRSAHDPRLNERFTSTNHMGATGDATQAAMLVGANTIQMDWIQLGPWTSPDEKGFGLAPLFVESTVGYGPMVDPATGKRFIQETGNRKVRADALVAMGHPGLIYSCQRNILNKVVGKNMTESMFERIQKSGVVRRFETLRELADYYKIPYDELNRTNTNFNKYMVAGEDPEFNCKIFKDAVPNDQGPFYACRLWPRVHHCMGGLQIDEQARVIDVFGKPIKGLYAAGEVTGGVHGMVRLGTVAVADCMIFGRVAARSAAKA